MEVYVCYLVEGLVEQCEVDADGEVCGLEEALGVVPDEQTTRHQPLVTRAGRTYKFHTHTPAVSTQYQA
jgi:hypothetical protein